jgi:O-antigen ligase
MFSSVIASGSRMGSVLVVAEVVGVIVIFAARNKLPRKTLVIRSVQFASLAAVAVALAGSQTLRTRLEAFGPEPLRADALRASIKMIEDHPAMGIGLGAWSTVYPRYASIDTGVFMNQAHNDWVQWAAEGGVPFLLLLVLLAAQLCKPAFRSIYGVGVVAFLLHSFVDYPMQQRPALACWFFAIAGAAVSVKNVRTHL